MHKNKNKVDRPCTENRPRTEIKWTDKFNTSHLGPTLFFVSTLVFESPARPQGVEVRP